jgi:hypothetical protein
MALLLLYSRERCWLFASVVRSGKQALPFHTHQQPARSSGSEGLLAVSPGRSGVCSLWRVIAVVSGKALQTFQKRAG